TAADGTGATGVALVSGPAAIVMIGDWASAGLALSSALSALGSMAVGSMAMVSVAAPAMAVPVSTGRLMAPAPIELLPVTVGVAGAAGVAVGVAGDREWRRLD